MQEISLKTMMFQKAIPESTIVRSQSETASCPDESDDEEFEGFSSVEIANAEIQCKKALDRCRRELAKLETCDETEDDEEEEIHPTSMCLMLCSHKLIIVSITKNDIKLKMITYLFKKFKLSISQTSDWHIII